MKLKHIIKHIIITLLLLVPIAYADMSITGIKQSYNFGEKISPVAHISVGDKIFNGFIVADLDCQDYSNNYLKMPVNVYGDATIPVLELTVFSQMKGKCRISVSLESIDKDVTDKVVSENFIVTGELIAFISDNGNLSINPADIITLSGILYNSRMEPIPGSLTVSLGSKSWDVKITDSTFNISLITPPDIKSGKNQLFLYFQDDSKNDLQESIPFLVIPRQTLISIELNSTTFSPYETLKSSINLLDQAGDKIGMDFSVRILNGKKEIFSGIQNNGDFSYFIPNTLVPGTYVLSASYTDIKKEISFEILSVEKINSTLSGSIVTFMNIGNVRYSGAVDILLNDGTGSFTIEKKISLHPGGQSAIDLSQEVVSGNYTVTLPNGEIFREVIINDERGFFKRAASGVKAITGNAISVGSLQEDKLMGFIIFIALAIIVLFALLYFKKPKAAKANLFDFPKKEKSAANRISSGDIPKEQVEALLAKAGKK